MWRILNLLGPYLDAHKRRTVASAPARAASLGRAVLSRYGLCLARVAARRNTCCRVPRKNQGDASRILGSRASTRTPPAPSTLTLDPTYYAVKNATSITPCPHRTSPAAFFFAYCAGVHAFTWREPGRAAVRVEAAWAAAAAKGGVARTGGEGGGGEGGGGGCGRARLESVDLFYLFRQQVLHRPMALEQSHAIKRAGNNDALDLLAAAIPVCLDGDVARRELRFIQLGLHLASDAARCGVAAAVRVLARTVQFMAVVAVTGGARPSSVIVLVRVLDVPVRRHKD